MLLVGSRAPNNGEYRRVDLTGRVGEVANGIVVTVVAVRHRHTAHCHGFSVSSIFIDEGKVTPGE